MDNFGLGCVAKQEVVGVTTNHVAYTIFSLTDGCISIAEPHCEVNLIIVSVEHRLEAVRKDNTLDP